MLARSCLGPPPPPAGVNDVPVPYPSALEAFVELFNGEEFWDSHEVLEGPWRDTRSEFYHGLILLASAYVHVQRGNTHGIVAQLEKAERALRSYRPGYLGVDLEPLFLHSAACRKAVAEAGDVPASRWREGIQFPRIQLQAELLRGNEIELEWQAGSQD